MTNGSRFFPCSKVCTLILMPEMSSKWFRASWSATPYVTPYHESEKQNVARVTEQGRFLGFTVSF